MLISNHAIVAIEMRRMRLKLVDVVKAVTSSFVKLTAKIVCGYHTTRMVIPVWACGGDIPTFVDCNAQTLVGPDIC